MPSNKNSVPSHVVRGWILDVYPSAFGEVAVWVVTENGKRIRLTDKFQPKIYLSGKEEDITNLVDQFSCNTTVASWSFVYKYAHPTDTEKTKVIEIKLRDCRKTSAFTKEILKLGNYQKYEAHNCDLNGDRAYFFDHDIFPLAFVEIHPDRTGLKYRLWDTVESINYSIPPLRVLNLSIDIAKKGKIPNLNDPLNKIGLNQANQQAIIENGDEKDKLLQLVKALSAFDPDIVLTKGGDSFLLSYLTQRAIANNVLDEFILGRDKIPLVSKNREGNTYFSYGRTFYKAPTSRLYGRIHIDQTNTFLIKEGGFEGLFEIARICRMPLHTAARASIGTSMSSIQFYQAIKNDILIPRRKSIPEAFKSAYELLVGDRGGFVYEPIVGLHEDVGEVDFSSMYPCLMINNNISAETVLCKCCPNSKRRIPELNYHICEKRDGIVPQALRLVVRKRFLYKRLKEEAENAALKESYDKRQAALKGILVSCFGYLGYRNAKFGTIDGHIGVCAFGREAFLKAARMAEARGFTVIHGIVDSMWLKKKDAPLQDYIDLCKAIGTAVGVSLHFEGTYKWIAFLPSKMHPHIGVLNRYYGVMENGKIKVRGIEVRKRDTPKFVYNTQMEMIQTLSLANNIAEFYEKIPQAIQVLKASRQKLLKGEVPIWDLMITKHLSKNPQEYKQHVSQLIAAEQAIREGAEIHAGENIRFIFTDADNKKHSRRVKAESLIEKSVDVDTEKYLQMLYDSAAGLLSFAEYTNKSIQDAVIGRNCKNLTQYK